MQIIVLATGNKHKLKEFKEMLQDYNIVSMYEVGFSGDIEENGKDFFENSLIKAMAIRRYLDEIGLDYWVMADDSGLCCNALRGKPGLYSARYAGDDANDEANRQKLLKDLSNADNRSAYFECVIACVRPDGSYLYGEGKTHGDVLFKYSGDTSFGYDCIFFSDDLKKSFGEASSDEKNSVSHRRRALQDLLKNITKSDWRK